MKGGDIYCLMVSGPGLTDGLRSLLFNQARRLLQYKKGYCRFRGSDFEGAVSTTNETGVIGSVSGVIFQAKLDIGNRTIEARYLVRAGDLADGEGQWIEWDGTLPFDPSLN